MLPIDPFEQLGVAPKNTLIPVMSRDRQLEADAAGIDMQLIQHGYVAENLMKLDPSPLPHAHKTLQAPNQMRTDDLLTYKVSPLRRGFVF